MAAGADGHLARTRRQLHSGFKDEMLRLCDVTGCVSLKSHVTDALAAIIARRLEAMSWTGNCGGARHGMM